MIITNQTGMPMVIELVEHDDGKKTQETIQPHSGLTVESSLYRRIDIKEKAHE